MLPLSEGAAASGEGLIFVFSLPRSGSTLLQRLLGAHPAIATASEPWIALPQLYALRDRGVYAEYGHFAMSAAIDDFCALLPRGRADYLDATRRYLLELYGLARGERRYFLDKSPRYHLVAGDLLELFPGARCVVLWRQPLAVAASIVDSFAGGRWNIDKYAVDLYDGVDNLLAAERAAAGRSCTLRYEDLVADPPAELERLWRFLDLDPGEAPPLDLERVHLQGRMGDETGTAAYRSVSGEPLEKWRRTMANPFRRWWCGRYLDWLGPARLRAMGYDEELLRSQVAGLGRGHERLGSDVVRAVAGYGYYRVAHRLINRPERPLSADPRRRRSR